MTNLSLHKTLEYVHTKKGVVDGEFSKQYEASLPTFLTEFNQDTVGENILSSIPLI